MEGVRELIQQYSYTPILAPVPKIMVHAPAGVVRSQLRCVEAFPWFSSSSNSGSSSEIASQWIVWQVLIQQSTYTTILAPVTKVMAPTQKCSTPYRF